MNALSFALILTLALTAAPSNAADLSTQAPGIVIDCARPALPSQQEVSMLTGIENYGQAYAARERLMRQGLRACKRGAAEVVIVRKPQTNAPVVAQVDRER